MTTLTIKVPAKEKEKLSAIIKELGGEIIDNPSGKGSKKNALLTEKIKQGLKEVKAIRDGISASYTMSGLFNEK